MRKYSLLLTITAVVLLALAACGSNSDTSTYDEFDVPGYVWERVGDVAFTRPEHWAGFLSQMEPHEGAFLEFWDPEFDADTPSFGVRKLPLDGTAPTLDELLAKMLTEERIDVINADIAPIIYPIYVAKVFGINTSESDWQYGKYEYYIKFVYEDWLYIVTAQYKDIYDHQHIILSILDSMMVGVEPAE